MEGGDGEADDSSVKSGGGSGGSEPLQGGYAPPLLLVGPGGAEGRECEPYSLDSHQNELLGSGVKDGTGRSGRSEPGTPI